MAILSKLTASAASLALSLAGLVPAATAERSADRHSKTERVKDRGDRRPQFGGERRGQRGADHRGQNRGYINEQRQPRREVVHQERRVQARETRRDARQESRHNNRDQVRRDNRQHARQHNRDHVRRDNRQHARQHNRDYNRQANRRENRQIRNRSYSNGYSQGYRHANHDRRNHTRYHNQRRHHVSPRARHSGYYYNHGRYAPRRYYYNNHRPYIIKSPLRRYSYNRHYTPRYRIGGHYGYHSNTIIIGDYGYWGLYDPPHGYHWVHDHDSGDAILASIATGAVIGLIIGALAH